VEPLGRRGPGVAAATDHSGGCRACGDGARARFADVSGRQPRREEAGLQVPAASRAVRRRRARAAHRPCRDPVLRCRPGGRYRLEVQIAPLTASSADIMVVRCAGSPTDVDIRRDSRSCPPPFRVVARDRSTDTAVGRCCCWASLSPEHSEQELARLLGEVFAVRGRSVTAAS
jgi:hypothetical protein